MNKTKEIISWVNDRKVTLQHSAALCEKQQQQKQKQQKQQEQQQRQQKQPQQQQQLNDPLTEKNLASYV